MEYVAGRLVFWRDGSLLAQSFDVDAARLTETPMALAEHEYGFWITGLGAFSASATRLEWLDRQGRPLGSAGAAADYVSVELSPDGSSVAYSARHQELGTNDI